MCLATGQKGKQRQENRTESNGLSHSKVAGKRGTGKSTAGQRGRKGGTPVPNVDRTVKGVKQMKGKGSYNRNSGSTKVKY